MLLLCDGKKCSFVRPQTWEFVNKRLTSGGWIREDTKGAFIIVFSNKRLRYTWNRCVAFVGGAKKQNDAFIPLRSSSSCCATGGKRFQTIEVTCRADYHTAREHRQVRPTEYQESNLSTAVWKSSCIQTALERKLKVFFYIYLRSILSFFAFYAPWPQEKEKCHAGGKQQ